MLGAGFASSFNGNPYRNPYKRVYVLTYNRANVKSYRWFYGFIIEMVPRRISQAATVKTTVDLPQELWRAAKIRAMDEHSDLRSVIIAALTSYLERRQGDAENDG